MNDIYKILDELNIKYKEHEHPPVFTVEEAEKYRTDIDGTRIKNLFLRNKKGNKHYLLIAGAFKQIDLKLVSQIIGENKIGFASPDRMLKYLGLTPGSVSPFGLINDENKEVVALIDKEILSNDILNFHPNINTSTIQISKDNFLKFMKWSGNNVMEIEI